MDDDEWTIDGKDEEDEDTDYIFKHDESIERYLENPDAIIASFLGYRFIFRVEPGCITDGNIKDVEKIIYDIAIDYEYPLYGLDVMGDRIEIKLRISVNEAPLESAERFQEHLERGDIIAELLYIGTIGKEELS